MNSILSSILSKTLGTMRQLIIVLLIACHERSLAKHDANLEININININVDNSEFQNKSVKLIDERNSLNASGRNFNKGSNFLRIVFIG